MGRLSFTDVEKTTLKNLSALSATKFANAELNNKALRRAFTGDIQGYLLSRAIGIDESSPDYTKTVEERLKDSSEETMFAKCMAVALVVGYFQSLNNDIEDSVLAEFGFDGLSSAFEDAVAIHLASVVSSEKALKTLGNGLRVQIRTCSPEEYFSGDLYHKDIETLSKLLVADIDDGYNKKMLEAIREIDDIKGAVTNYISDIKAVYTLLFEDSFGVDTYKGVMYSGGEFLTIEGDSTEATPVHEAPRTLAEFASRVYKRIDDSVYISDKRQFDYGLIFEKSQTVYFPRKILEYALGRESTLNILRNYYKSPTYSPSWTTYMEQYLAGNIDAVLYRGAYRAFEKVLLDKKSIKSDFASLDFRSSVSDYKAFITEKMKLSGVFDSVRKLLGKVAKSMKSAYILTKYPYLAGQIAAINFRVCSAPGVSTLGTDAATSRHLFKNLVAENDNEQFAPPVDISSGRKVDGKNVSANICEYQYDINPLLTKAEPLFGYTVQRQNKKKGISAGWNNILIGRSASGKEVYAASGSDVKMQNYFIHNIIAGSRSGKGVMTMNLLANALAAGKPIFYLDRKPDMASMLFGLSKGGQFIVNGGFYNPKTDNTKVDSVGVYNETQGVAMSPWRDIARPFLEANPRIAELFGPPGSGYEGVLGDYIYFRAFMFCFGLCVLRAKLPEKHEFREMMNGNDGIVIVVDELTGFQQSISSLLSTISSRMVQSALNLGDSDSIIEQRNKLMRKLALCESQIENAKNEPARLKAENEYEDTKVTMSKLVDEQSLYAATLFQKILDSFKTASSLAVAGFRGGEFNYSDIFVLGQYLDANYYATSLDGDNGQLSTVFFPLLSSGKDYRSIFKGADIVRSFLEQMSQEDWFLGRNAGYNYAMKEASEAVRQWIDDDGNWEYIACQQSQTCNAIRAQGGQVVDASMRPVLFKPYLVLNMSNEGNPPSDDRGDFQYVAQCRDRVNKSAGGEDLWETVRLKHLKPGVVVTADEKHYGSLDDGIGFAGLVEATLETIKTKSGNPKQIGDINEYIAKILSRSGKIADAVAKKMHYNSWQELIFDFSKEGLFSFDDMVRAVLEPSEYTEESRLPLYAKLGMLGNESESVGDMDDDDEQSFDDQFGDIGDSVSVDEAAVGGSDYRNVDPFQSSAPPPTQEPPRPLDTRAAAQQMWGNQTQDSAPPPPPSTPSQGGQSHAAGQTNTEVISALWSQAMMLARVAVMMDTSGYQYTEDDVEVVAQTAFELLKEFAGVS